MANNDKKKDLDILMRNGILNYDTSTTKKDGKITSNKSTSKTAGKTISSGKTTSSKKTSKLDAFFKYEAEHYESRAARRSASTLPYKAMGGTEKEYTYTPYTNKTEIKSNLSEKDRKARIKEIEDEMRNLNSQISGIRRAETYANNEQLKLKKQETEARIAELSNELKTLQRVGTFTPSELKQFELDDARAEKAKIPTYSPTARISTTQADALKANIKARSDIDKKIGELEREQANYKKLEWYDELNAHTAKIISNKDFAQNAKYTPLQPKTDAELKAEGYKKDAEGEWYKPWGMGFRETYTGEDSDLYIYINDPSKRLAIDTDQETTTKNQSSYKTNGYATMTEAEVGAFNYLYHQDRKNGTKTAEEYLKQIGPMLEERALKVEADRYAELSKESPVLMSGVSLATNFGNALMFPAKAVATATGEYENMPMLDMYGNRTQAIRGAVSEDMGGVGKLLYNAGMSIGDMGVAMLAGGGNAKVVQAIMSSSAGSSTISEAKKNGASDGKALIMGFGSAAIEWATEKYSVEAILKNPKGTLDYLAKNTFTEATEEGASNLGNWALDTIVSEVFGERNELEQRIDYLVQYEGKSEEEALQIAFLEKAQSLGEDILVGGLSGFGMSTVASAPAVVQKGVDALKGNPVNVTAKGVVADEESLDALIEEGKASGAGTESAKIATEIETAKKSGEKITTGQVKNLIKANEEAIKKEQTAKTPERTAVKSTPSQIVETKSINNEPISVEEAKRASGYDENGAKLLAELVNTTPNKSFSEIESSVHNAYMAGRANRAVNFDTPLKKEMYNAGLQDRIKSDAIRALNAKNVVVNKESGFDTKNLPKDVTQTQAEIVDTLFKAVGVKGYIATGLKGNAEINRATGEVAIDTNFQREYAGETVSIVFHAAHEAAMHRVYELAPKEASAFMYEMYKHIAGKEGSNFTLAGEKRNAYLAQDVNISLGQAMEEVSANKILELYHNDEAKFHKAINSIANGTNLQAKQGLRKYIEYLTDFIRKIGEVLKGKTAQERAEIQTELNEIRRLRDMFESAFAKAVENKKSLETKSDTNSAKNLEIKTNEEYNGNKSHSLYDEYNSIGMQWAYHSETKVGDRKVIYNSHTDEFVLVEATKDGVGFIELRTVDYEQIREDEEIYESKKQRVVDRKVYRTETGQNNNARDNGDAENGRTGKQNAELSEGKSRGDRTTDTQTSDGDLNYSLKDSEGNPLTEAQQEYFKDSKVRDENGNLLVMYQGSANDFTVFDRKKSGYANLYGRGFYFTKSENHASQYGKTRAYYLNIKHPVSTTETTITKSQLRKFLQVVSENEDYSFENYGYGATVESVLDSTYSKSDFLMLNDVSQTAIGDLVEAVELFNEVNGTDYDGIILDTETVTFNSEQAKLTTNENPTSDPDIRFNLKESVEETKNLIAVHNVWEYKLREAFELGGLPSPSIAVTKKDFSHDNFGDISLLFRKETISPTDRRNKVYGGDAYTPAWQGIDYKINEKTLGKIKERVTSLVDKDIRDTYRVYFEISNVESEISRANGNFVEAYKRNEAFKIAFLKDAGIPFKPVMKTKELSHYADNVVVRRVARALGEETLKKSVTDSKVSSAQEPMIRKLLNDRMEEQGRGRIYDKPLPLFDVDDIIRAAREYNRVGETKTVDYRATFEKLDTKFTKKLTAEYENWLAELGKGIIEKKGIRNDKDLFTPSGNRRSFEALHWDYTLENIVKSLNSKQSKGSAAWGGNVFGASTKEYGSIADIKADSSRLQEMTDEEYEELKSEYKDRLDDIAQVYANGKSFFDAEDTLIEAIATKKTKQGMRSYLAQFDYVYKTTDDIVNDLWELRNDISQMPVSYFEAKPQRAVGFNEVAAAIIPRTKDKSLKTELENRGVKVLEYDKSKDGDRLKKINSVPDVSFSLKNTDINTKDRQQLLDTIEHLKNEFKISKFAKTDPKKLTKMTKDILKEYSSQADFDETFKDIDALYQYMANGEDGHPAVWEDVYSKAHDIAQEIVKEALVVDDYMYQEYKSLRNYLRTTPIKFYSEYDSSPIAYDDFNSFRKSNFGRLRFTKDGLPIDTVYQELSHLYPEFFNEERESNTADQLERIMEVLDDIQPQEVNPYSRELQEASAYLANDIISRFYDIPQAKPTFADKAERRVTEAKIKGANKVELVKQQRDEKVKKVIETQKAKAQKQIDKLRQQRDEKVRKEQQKRRDAISKMSENQKVKVYRARIERHASDLSKKLISPTDKQHIPQDLQGAVAKLLECINLESNYTYDTESHSYKKNDEGLPSKRTKAFEELRTLYGKIADSVVVDPDLIGEEGLLSDVIKLADKRIVDMNSNELDTVWQTLRAVEASVNNANKMFSQGKYETILEYAEALRKDNAGKKERSEYKGVIGKAKTLATLDMLTPETYFHQLGKAGDSIFRMMRDAQDKHISIMKEVSDFTHRALKDVDVNSLEKTLHTVKLGGEDVQLSTAQLMELYVLMKREQAVDHILIGGILPDVSKGKGLKLNTKAKPIRNLSVAEISSATDKLTKEQKKVADKLQRYVSTVLSEYGNEASMKVYNYEKFLEKNYWTIRTNKQEVNSEVGKDTSVTSVAGKGMAKGTVPHANTSVRIGSIFDTFSAHSSDMATYAAWLGTSEDINRIRNFAFWDEGARTGTVKEILDTVHGIRGSEYLQKLLTDVAIGVKGTDNMNPFDKFIGHYKAASVGANLRVIIQQPTALLRALDMIDAQYLTIGAVKPLKGWAKAKKYAPIAQWKDWGYFDVNTGRQMKDVLFDNANFIEKTKQVGMWGASMADSLAWGQLWNAVEAETKSKHKELEVGAEAYYETVAKRFTEIVDHTQVVDGILQRSQIMRSSDTATKMATSFMGEPTKQYNMAMAAAYDAKNTKGDAKKKAVARLGRTAMSLAVAGIVNACAQSIIDAMRDDDKEKDYWERWLAAFKGDEDDKWFQKLGNIGDTVNPLNYIPFFKDIISTWSGYDVKRMDMEGISKASNAVANMYKAVTGTGKYTIAEASAQLFAEVARLYGVPVANVKRDVKSGVMAIALATDSYYMQYRMEKAMLDINYAQNRKNFMDILFNAYNNDREAYEKIYYDMIESGFDADALKKGMDDRMKNAQGVKEVSDLTKRYMTPTTEKKYDSSMKQISSSEVWKTATAEQRQDAKADLYEFLTSDRDDFVKTREEAKAAGVDETEYTLWKLAIEMADQPKGEEGSGNYDSAEKAKAINSLDLGDEEIAYFFGRGANEYAKEEISETLEAGIDMKEYVNFKAATSKMEADKNAKGNSIPNSKKKKVVNYLNSADLTDEEWKYFYYEIMNYKK